MLAAVLHGKKFRKQTSFRLSSAATESVSDVAYTANGTLVVLHGVSASIPDWSVQLFPLRNATVVLTERRELGIRAPMNEGCSVCGGALAEIHVEDRSKPPASFAGMSPMGHWQWTCTGRSIEELDGEPAVPAVAPKETETVG